MARSLLGKVLANSRACCLETSCMQPIVTSVLPPCRKPQISLESSDFLESFVSFSLSRHVRLALWAQPPQVNVGQFQIPHRSCTRTRSTGRHCQGHPCRARHQRCRILLADANQHIAVLVVQFLTVRVAGVASNKSTLLFFTPLFRGPLGALSCSCSCARCWVGSFVRCWVSSFRSFMPCLRAVRVVVHVLRCGWVPSLLK